MVKKAVGKKQVSKVEKKLPNDMEYLEKVSPEDLAEEGLHLEDTIKDSNEYFDVYQVGKPEAFRRVNLQQELHLLWERGKNVDKKLWRMIRFNIPTANPLFNEMSFDKILARMKEEKNSLILQDPTIIGLIGKQIWDKGTVLKVPPEVAKVFVTTFYYLGYEGLGDISNVHIEGLKREPKKLFVASYIDRLGD